MSQDANTSKYGAVEEFKAKKNRTLNESSIANKILIGIIAIGIIIIALGLFVGINEDRITEQNESYLQGSTEQAARRINDLLDRSLDIVESAAIIYEENANTHEVTDPATIAKRLKITSFDYTFFVTPDGIGYRDEDGKAAEVGERLYYTNGMKGESGIVALSSGAWYDKNILVFYAPVKHNGEIIGVFCGAYRDKTISEYYMTAEYFGYLTPTYLCSPSGNIVARSSASRQAPESLRELLSSANTSVPIDEIYSKMENGTPVSFSYHIEDGDSGSAYLVKLADYDWTLIRAFPNQITETMIWKASIAGFVLVGGVITAAAIVLIMLVIRARKQRQTLMLERQKAERVIDTSTELFHSVFTVDIATGDYEFLAPAHSMRDIFPDQGNIETMIESVANLSEGEYKQVIRDHMMTSEMKRRLEGKPGLHPFYQFEQRLSNPDYSGDERWLQASVLDLDRDEDGELKTTLVTVQDVTDIKVKEIEQRYALEEACRAAEYASKAKSDFLNSMSHDIRTPMNSIMGLTAIAAMHVDDSTRVKECLQNISAASQHLLGLINEVLDMAKIESGNIALAEESFDLSELVEGMLTIVHPQIENKNQTLHTELADIKHENVIGDPTRLQQVFINIMGNATKFTPEGGNVTLRIKEIESRLPGHACFEFQFEDDGIGMSEEFLETIFEPFARAHDTRIQKTEGSGLGMSIVKNVVDMMNGNIYVESEEGVGTKFTVIINLKIDDAIDDDNNKVNGRAIVIDDDETTCEIAVAMLKEIGMEADYRVDAEEGIEAVLAADRENPYDAVLLDWKMPVMSGVEVAKEIRTRAEAKIPIIIFSGYDWSVIEEEAKSVGVDVFVMKPLFKSRLLKLMKEMLSGESENPLDQSKTLEELAYHDKHILLAEDNMMAAEIAKEIVGMTGAKVTHAENGKIAYETALESEPGTFDLVLMDIQMPLMNGYEATRAIRAAVKEHARADLGELPIVALSADAFEDDIKNALDAGMNAHLSKPLDINNLVKMLHKFIDGEN